MRIGSCPILYLSDSHPLSKPSQGLVEEREVYSATSCRKMYCCTEPLNYLKFFLVRLKSQDSEIHPSRSEQEELTRKVQRAGKRNRQGSYKAEFVRPDEPLRRTVSLAFNSRTRLYPYLSRILHFPADTLLNCQCAKFATIDHDSLIFQP